MLGLGELCSKIMQVGNMGTVTSETKLMDKWAASKRTQVSAIVCIKLLPLLENAVKLNFKCFNYASGIVHYALIMLQELFIMLTFSLILG